MNMVTDKKSSKPNGPAAGAQSAEARKLAATILEVLAGESTPADAVESLGISMPRYYTLELRAINGLIAACEPRLKGRVQSESSKIESLEKDVVSLRKDCARQQALLRTTQRAVGLAARKKSKVEQSGRKRRRHKPRGLKVVAKLRKADKQEAEAAAAESVAS